MGLLCLSHMYSGYFGDDSTGIMSLIIMMHSRHSVANNSITNTGDNIVAINRRNYGCSIIIILSTDTDRAHLLLYRILPDVSLPL